MKRKTFFRALVALLILILSFGVLAACNDDNNAATCTISFFNGDETVKTLDVVHGYKLRAYDIPEAPVYEGKQFKGWYLVDNETEVTEGFTVNASKVVVYAQYVDVPIMYTVTFVDNVSGSAVTVKTVEIEKGHSLTAADIPTAPEHEGKLFDGWYVSGSQVEVSEGYIVNGAITVTAQYLNVYEEDGFRYQEKRDGTYIVTTVKENYGYPATVTIKEEFNGKAVTEIGSMKRLTSSRVIVPQGITTIADGAFADSMFVHEVDLSAFKGTIGAEAFKDSALRYIDLGSTTAIGDKAFNGSDLILLFVPASVKSVGASAFDSDSLIEIGFESAFPTVHGSVFGSGERSDDSLSIVASVTAWEALTDCAVDDANFIGSVKDKLSVEQASIFTWSDEMIADAVAYHGCYVGEDIKVYLSMGINAVLDKDGDATVTSVFDGEEPSDHIYDYVSALDTSDRDTYYLDKETKTAQLLEANAAGEVIKGEYLYDYKGKALRYTVSSKVTKIAGGAGQLNSNVRFLEIGDNITSIGSFAFSSGQLFGIAIGSKVERIEDFAFFDQNYLIQLIFYSPEDAPVIGQGAFTVLVSGAFAPVTYNQMAQYGVDVNIYLVNDIKHYDWDLGYVYDEGAAFKDALDQALAGLPVVKVGNIGDAEEDFKDAKYEDNRFTTFTTSHFAGKGKQYTCSLGTITMSGTTNGYAYIDFADGGSGYIYFNHIPGYSLSYYDDQSVPLKIEVFTGIIGGKMQSKVIYGYFKETALVLRGAEAGIYGDIDKEYFIIDGYDKIEYHKQDGSIVNGTYTAAGNVLTVSGIDGITEVTADTEEHELTYGGNHTLTALGEEAGVYYDIFHAATVKLDGKSFKQQVGDGDDAKEISYSGKLYYTLDGETVSAPYVIDGKNITFVLNGENKKWTFDMSSNTVSGDYDGDYNTYTFKNISIGLHGTFTNDQNTLVLDGFFTATVNGESYNYYLFESSVVVFETEGAKIYNLDVDHHTYSEPTAAEAGVYYASSGENDRVVFNGLGQLLYINGSDLKVGDYTIKQNSITVHINGSTDAQHTGYLDAQNGIGYIVYDYSGDTFLAVSKTKFDIRNKSTYIPVYNETDGAYSLSVESMTVHVSNGYIIYGNGSSWSKVAIGFTVKKLEGNIEGPVTITVEVTVKEVLNVNITVDIPNANVLASVGTVEYLCTDASGYTYYISWLDDAHKVAGIYYYSYGYPYNTVVGDVSKTNEQTFTVSDGTNAYTVSGYGTDSVTLTKNQ